MILKAWFKALWTVSTMLVGAVLSLRVEDIVKATRLESVIGTILILCSEIPN